jgi:RNA polymerase sigma-32 factor
VKEREVVEMEQRLGARELSVDAPLDEGEPELSLIFSRHPRRLPTRSPTRSCASSSRRGAEEFKTTLKGKDLVVFERRLEPLMRDEEPVTLQEVGDEFGITRERVRQIEARVKRRLAEYLQQQIPDLREIEFGVKEAR